MQYVVSNVNLLPLILVSCERILKLQARLKLGTKSSRILKRLLLSIAILLALIIKKIVMLLIQIAILNELLSPSENLPSNSQYFLKVGVVWLGFEWKFLYFCILKVMMEEKIKESLPDQSNVRHVGT